MSSTLTNKLRETIKRGEVPKDTNIDRIIEHAQINKSLFHLLRRMNGVPNSYSSVLESLEEDYKVMLKVLKQVCNSLSGKGLDYCVFKTLRSVPYVPADVDILVFQEKEMDEAVEAIKSFGAEVDSSSPFDVALYLKDEDFYVDLHNRIHVAGFSYIPKKALCNHLVRKRLRDNTPIELLEDAYELSVLVGHSLFKEQVVTLLDFYTVSSLLSDIEKDSLYSALRKTGMILPFKYFLKKSCKSGYFPIKVNPFELFAQFSYKFVSEPEARGTFFDFLKSFFNKDKIDTILEHFTRDTY